MASTTGALVFALILSACGKQFSTSDAASAQSLHESVDQTIKSVYSKQTTTKTSEELLEEYIVRLEQSLEHLNAVDTSTLPEEIAKIHSDQLVYLETRIEELKTDETARQHLLQVITETQARIADGRWEQQRETARNGMCEDLGGKLNASDFPSEEMRQAVQAQFDRSCKTP